jgi:hypothetical protein
MLGPIWSYQDIYVALCGQLFSTHYQGIRHERHCEACQQVRAGDFMEEAV